MATLMQQRRGTAAEWAIANPILAEGEIGVELDTGIVKVGNGADNWNTLNTPYILNVGGTMHAPLATDVPFSIQRNANQVADLFRIVDVNGTVLSGINAKGVFFQTGSQRVTAKGDILVGSNPDVMTRLAVGSVGLVLTADPTSPTGVKWAAASKAADVQIFTASTTWVKPPNARAMTVVLFGAGASGQATITGSEYAQSPGGQSGSRIWADLLPSAVPDTVSVIVGAGGPDSTIVGNSAQSTGPTPGGDSVFGPLRAKGGGQTDSTGSPGGTGPSGAPNSAPAPLGAGGGGGSSIGYGVNQVNGTSSVGTTGQNRSGSSMGGDGGYGASAPNGGGAIAGPGKIPGGGGGGACSQIQYNGDGAYVGVATAVSGAGARGEVIVVTFF